MTDTRVAGRYETLEVVGRGGEATVLKAIDTRHERLVALKVRVVPNGGSPDDLLVEARALLTLPAHPGLAHARDDLFDGGRHVLVLDWVDGVNLARLLADEGRPGLPVSSVLRWIAQTAEALTVLHQHGVVHGDVKPANLILDRDGRIVLVDLGSSSMPMTDASRGGTPGFRAPEIAGGAPADRSSDVFSLAATAFALLTGTSPTGGRPDWIGIHADVAHRLEAALRTGLAIDPARRPATPGELVERLRAGWEDQTPTGVATVLLTDVVDSSKLWEQSPQRVPALLAEMQLVVDRNVEEHGGRRVGATVEGDATVSVFPSAVNAVRAAIGLQRALASRSGALRVRAGLATGELIPVEGDVLGPTLNRAARIREFARAGEVLLASSTAEVVRLASLPGVDLMALGPHALRGLDGADEVAAVVAAGVSTPPDPARSPYPGLASFRPEDADLFFGREELIERCMEQLQSEGFIAVVGASGSGKTSLVLAGLAPRLTDVVVLRPGVHPLRSLEAAGLSGRETALLIVDQLEELVILCEDASERAAFVDEIVAHSGGLIVTARADLYGEFGAFDQLASRLTSSQVLLGPLADRELRRAVQEPAHRCGLVVEEGLADVIVADLEDAPGALPLLGHALREAWQRRDGRTITLAGYRESGGVRSAIATTAEQALAALDNEGQAVARRILLRMVELRPDGDDARRWVSHREVTEIDPCRATDVVATLAGARLLVVDRDQITVVHEALLRAWPRLSGWIAEERADLLARQEVRWAAERWVAGGRTDGDLYRGGRLDAALDLAARAPFPSREAEFVDAGRQLRDREQADTRRRARRLRVLATVTSLLAVVAIVVGAIAVVQRNDAEQARGAADESARVADEAAGQAVREAQRADAAADDARRETQRADASGTLAEARRLGTQALVQDDYDQALLLAVEGRHLQDSRETRENLLATINRSPDASAVIRSQTEAFMDLAFTPDGRTMLASGRGETPTLTKYDVTTRRRAASISGPGPGISSAVSPDGRHAVMSSHTGNFGERVFELRVVDVATFEDVGPPLSGLVEAPPTRLSFSPDGRYIAAVTDSDLSGAGVYDAFALVWDVAKGGGPIVQYQFSAENFQRDVAFLPDSQRILVAGAAGTAIVDIATGREVGRVDGAYPPIAVGRDGAVLAATTDVDPGVIIGLFDLTSGERSAVLAGHRERLVRLAFSPDGSRLASGADDRLVMVWDADSGQRTVYEGHAAGVNALAFSPDGKTLWSGGDDRAIFAWDLEHTDTLVHQASPAVADGPALPFAAQGMVVGPDGHDVAFPSTDQVPFLIRDVDTGALGAPVDDLFLSFSPDGDRYVSVDVDLRLRLWDRDSGELLAVSDDGVFSPLHEGTAVFTPDGRRIVALRIDPSGAADNDDLVVVDAESLAPVGRESVPVGSTGRMVGVTPDGRQAVVVVSGIDRPGTAVLVVDLETRRIVRSTPVEPGGEPFGGARNNTVASDGRIVGIGGVLGDVIVVDAVTGDVSPLLHAHDDFVESVMFAPDYTSFVTTGRDGAVKLWDAATQALVGSVLPLGPNHRVRASFLDTDRVLIVYDTGEILEWDPRPDAWEAHACKVAGRNLTTTEWAELFPDQAYRVTCRDFPAGE